MAPMQGDVPKRLGEAADRFAALSLRTRVIAAAVGLLLLVAITAALQSAAGGHSKYWHQGWNYVLQQPEPTAQQIAHQGPQRWCAGRKPALGRQGISQPDQRQWIAGCVAGARSKGL